MPRPTNKSLRKKFLDAIPAEGISRARLAEFLGWSSLTFDHFVEKLCVNEISIGPGGRGGVITRISSAKTVPAAQRKSVFLRTLRRLTSSDPARGVSNGKLRYELDWEEEDYWRVQKALVKDEKIGRKSGQGGVVYLLAGANDDDDASIVSNRAQMSDDSALEDIGQTNADEDEEEEEEEEEAEADEDELDQNSSEDETEASDDDELDLPTVDQIDSDTETLLQTVRRLSSTTHDLRNIVVRNELQWGEERYWQARTALRDRGSIHVERGWDGSIREEKRSIARLDVELVSQSKVLHMIPKDGSPIAAKTIIAKLGINPEFFAEIRTRLLRDRLIQMLPDGAVRLADALVPNLADSHDDEREVLQVLPEPSRPMAMQKLRERLKWSEARISSTCAGLCDNGLITLDDEVGTIQTTSKAASFLAKTRRAAGTSLCRPLDVFDELAELVKARKVTAFLGAGVSRAAGLPSWRELLDEIYDQAAENLRPDERSEIRSYIDHGNLIDAASALEDKLATNFQSVVQRALGPGAMEAGSPPLLNALAHLSDRLASIVTTNLDDVLERALKWPAVHALQSGVNLTKKIVKIHGTLDDPSSWVFTRSAYNRRYFGSAEYRDRLHAMYQEQTFMFVGYGMQDYELDTILSWMEGTYDRNFPKHYFFIMEDEEGKRPYFFKRLARLGLRPIVARSFESLHLLLSQLALR